MFLLIGVRVEAESRTNNGRIDAVICDGDHVYIFEFKINQTAEIALEQIREKEYFRKYQHSDRKNCPCRSKLQYGLTTETAG